MEALKRIALLLVGLGVGELEAAEATPDEKSLSPIFSSAAAVAPDSSARVRPEPTPVSRQLAALIRSEVSAAPPVPADGTASAPAAPGGETLQLEKMTVQGKRILEPPRRETSLDKFTRTGHLWEFSDTKRLMIGPVGDKVGLMFNFDW